MVRFAELFKKKGNGLAPTPPPPSSQKVNAIPHSADKEKLIADLAELRSRYPMQSHIRCQICGRWFRSLSRHLGRHSATGADYKREYNILTVTSDETRQKMTRGKEAIAEAERIWLLKYWNKDIFSVRQAIEILGIRESQLKLWCKILGLTKFRRKNWTKEEIIAGLQERAQKGLPLNYKAIRQENYSLVNVATKRFGSYAQAIQSAGLDYKKIKLRNWDKELIIKTIQEFARKGLPLNTQAIVKENRCLYDASRQFFGSYAQAIQSAGLDYKKIILPRGGDM